MKQKSKIERDDLISFLSLCVDAFAHIDRAFENSLRAEGKRLISILKEDKSKKDTIKWRSTHPAITYETRTPTQSYIVIK